MLFMCRHITTSNTVDVFWSALLSSTLYLEHLVCQPRACMYFQNDDSYFTKHWTFDNDNYQHTEVFYKPDTIVCPKLVFCRAPLAMLWVIPLDPQFVICGWRARSRLQCTWPRGRHDSTAPLRTRHPLLPMSRLYLLPALVHSSCRITLIGISFPWHSFTAFANVSSSVLSSRSRRFLSITTHMVRSRRY